MWYPPARRSLCGLLQPPKTQTASGKRTPCFSAAYWGRRLSKAATQFCSPPSLRHRQQEGLCGPGSDLAEAGSNRWEGLFLLLETSWFCGGEMGKAREKSVLCSTWLTFSLISVILCQRSGRTWPPCYSLAWPSGRLSMGFINIIIIGPVAY